MGTIDTFRYLTELDFWGLDLFFIEWSPDTVDDNFGITICSERFQYMTKTTKTVHMSGNNLFVHF